MSLYIHESVLSVKTPNSRTRRICIVGLSYDSILLACFGKLISYLFALGGPFLEYLIFKRLKNKLEEYDNVKIISYYSIRNVRVATKLGVEMLVIEAQDGVYEFVAFGRWAKFGAHKFLEELKERIEIVNPNVDFEES